MSDPDRELLRGIERGDRVALEGLAREYAGPVYRYLVRMSGDATLAEDLAQDVAYQIWRALPGRRFPNRRALNAWVYTVAANAFRMHVRRKRSSEVPLDAEIDLPAGDECDPLRSAERSDLALRVRKAVESLPEPERQALLMKAFGDLRYQEISAATGEPVGTVKWRISRAYAWLRRLLNPEVFPREAREDDYETVRSASSVSGRGAGPDGAMAHAASPAALPGVYGANRS